MIAARCAVPGCDRPVVTAADYVEVFCAEHVGASLAGIRRQFSSTAPIRLACMICDRDDGDGTNLDAALRAGWVDIERVHSEPVTESDWWTHLGWCPECK